MERRATKPLPQCSKAARFSDTLWALTGEAESATFREGMRRVVGGVTIISTLHDGEPWGMTVSAFTPVCMAPPTLLICVNSRTVTASDISRDGRFAVNLLSLSQRSISQLCSRPGENKYLGDCVVSPTELPMRIAMPVLRDSIVTFDCKAIEVRPVGTHLVVIASVGAILAPNALSPLLYGEGRYLYGVGLDDLSETRSAHA
jgi:flavin reductase (DIM6/NTAB) family NADH-FMN oxidoreductase RutF